MKQRNPIIQSKSHTPASPSINLYFTFLSKSFCLFVFNLTCRWFKVAKQIAQFFRMGTGYGKVLKKNKGNLWHSWKRSTNIYDAGWLRHPA